MIFNSSQETFEYIQTLLDKKISITEPNLEKICSLNSVDIQERLFVAGDSNKTTLKSIELLENGSFSVELCRESWIKNLPELYHDNEFLQRFLFGIQQNYQKTEAKLDDISYLFNPSNTEFIDWLASWVGISFSSEVSEHSKRRLVQNMVRLYKIRGSKEYLVELIEYLTNVVVRIDDNPIPKLIHHNLMSKNSMHRSFIVYIDDRISKDTEQEDKKIAMIRHILHNEKPINVEFSIVYKYMDKNSEVKQVKEKVIELHIDESENYDYDNYES